MENIISLLSNELWWRRMTRDNSLKTVLTACIIFILLGGMLIPLIHTGDINVDITTSNSNIRPNNDGNTLYVGGNGPNNYTKIQDAIDNATEGDTVFVYDDSSLYYENVRINKSIGLIGENKETTRIDGNRNGSIILISANKTIVSNFTIKNEKDTGSLKGGIYVSSNRNRISHNIITNNTYGVHINSGTHNNISQNKIIENRDDGIFLMSGEANTIFNNEIVGNWDYGVTLDTATQNTFTQNNIINNNRGDIVFQNTDTHNIINKNTIGTFYLGTRDYEGRPKSNFIMENSFINGGICVWNAVHNIIINNTINGKPLIYLEQESHRDITHAGQIILIDCQDVTIKNQNISHTKMAIQLWHSNKCSIEDNQFHDNDIGIACYKSRKNHIKNNYITKSKWNAIYLWNSHKNTIKDNTLTYSKYGQGIELYYHSNKNTITRNTITANQIGIDTTTSNYNTIKHNNINNNTWIGIAFTGSKHNTIMGNAIQGNKLGITFVLNSNGNKICRNNFKSNTHHATFEGCFHNWWTRNYWDDWFGWIPRPIRGETWINFDWFPRIIPYKWWTS